MTDGMTDPVRVGLVGVGAMGEAIARRLLDQGFQPVVCDLDVRRVDALVQRGAVGAGTPATVVTLAGTVLTALPTPEAVDAAVLGQHGLATGAQAGTVVVDLTSSSPDMSRTVSDALAARGAGYLDAGVLGNPPTAEAGTMTLLVGGDGRHLEQVRGVLDAISGRVWHLGAVGSGHAAKIVANELFLAQVAAMGEALGVLERTGGDPDTFLEALAGVGGRAVGLADIGRTMRGDPPPVGFALRLAAKDARLLAELASGAGADAPLSSALRRLYASAAESWPDEDFTRVYLAQRPAALGQPHDPRA